MCGDDVVDAPEECDDGNLSNGDGCSSSCTEEGCGNGSVDANEQCDDGNAADADGCNRYCQIEFCGDSTVQSGLGEQCDDGNGIAGDGCTKACLLEDQPTPPTAPPGEDPKDTAPEDDPSGDGDPFREQPSELPAGVPEQATQSLEFILSGPGDAFVEYLTPQDNIRLTLILQKLGNGRRLTAQEREWAETLYYELDQAKTAERSRYTDLLRQFISTPISADVVEEKELEKTRLVDVEVPVAIKELDAAINVIRRGEIGSQVNLDVARLRRQGLDLDAELPVDYQSKFQPGIRPIEVFATLSSMKESTEKYATTSVPASLDIIRAEAQLLKQSLPILQREYGVDPADIEPLLSAIEAVSLEATKEDTERVVGAINRFLGVLQRRGIVTTEEFLLLDQRKLEAAGRVRRLLEESGRTGDVTTEDVASIADGLSQAAPAESKPAFELGGDLEQRDALLKLLEGDTRIHDLRASLRADGRTDFDARYETLRKAIDRITVSNAPGVICDDSVPAALECVNEYLLDLQDAVRGRSFFSRFIGNLQDFFGIGS